MAKLDFEGYDRDSLRFAAELDQHKAAAQETIAEMGEEWLMAIMDCCKRIDENPDNSPPLWALSMFAKIGIMATVADVSEEAP